jgi:regulator of RNase E activity RraA
MTARAKAKGVKGVVIDGRCRDLAEHRAADYLVRKLSFRLSEQINNAYI